MATAVIMPKQGQSVETCIITKWFKNKGERVSVGDILFSYETDKASFDLESPYEGILLDIFFKEGAEVPVLTNVAVMGISGETTNTFNPEKSDDSAVSAPPVSETSEIQKHGKPVKAEKARDMPGESFTANRKIKISPRAKRLAEYKKLNYNDLPGSGPGGRIIISDIEKVLSDNVFPSKKPITSGGEYTDQPLSNVRKLVAKAMHSSLQKSAQITHHMSADVRYLLEARRKIKEKLTAGKNQDDITLNDMLCWCTIRALEKFPEVNGHLLDDRIRIFKKVHLGIAVDTKRGLMVPAVQNAGDLDLITLSKELKTVAEACKKGNINPESIQSTAASFTVSNLGNYGVEMFTPVINLPQVAILGVCTITDRPAKIENNIFGFVPYIGLSLTYDHRAIDGGPATLFLREIKEQIEGFRY